MDVDRRRGEVLLFEEEPVAKNHRSVKAQTWLGAIPSDKFVDGVTV